MHPAYNHLQVTPPVKIKHRLLGRQLASARPLTPSKMWSFHGSQLSHLRKLRNSQACNKPPQLNYSAVPGRWYNLSPVLCKRHLVCRGDPRQGFTSRPQVRISHPGPRCPPTRSEHLEILHAKLASLRRVKSLRELLATFNSFCCRGEGKLGRSHNSDRNA